MDIEPDEYIWHPINLDPSVAIVATVYRAATILTTSGQVWLN